MKKTKYMIPIGILLGVLGAVIFIAGVLEANSAPVSVGQKFTDCDPFAQGNVTVLSTSGVWVKYEKSGDPAGSFRTCTLTQFRAWYPNEVK